MTTTFSDEKADKAVNFIESRCRHTRGDFAGRRFRLAPWQRDGIIRPLFGTVNEHGLRQYRTAFVSRAKKNGKSAEGAAIALYLLCEDGESGAEVYSAAADRDQAAIVFNVAAQMVRLDPGTLQRMPGYRFDIADSVRGSGLQGTLSKSLFETRFQLLWHNFR
ncbi:MAG: terminase large subunit [Bryobacteraceae bacterium]